MESRTVQMIGSLKVKFITTAGTRDQPIRIVVLFSRLLSANRPQTQLFSVNSLLIKISDAWHTPDYYYLFIYLFYYRLW
jgi:hypothetical protein